VSPWKKSNNTIPKVLLYNYPPENKLNFQYLEIFTITILLFFSEFQKKERRNIIEKSKK